MSQQETDKLHEQERKLYEADKNKMAIEMKSLEDELSSKSKNLNELEVCHYYLLCLLY